MAQLVIRNLPADIKLRLQRRVERHGRTLEKEVREILREAAKETVEGEVSPALGLGTEIAALFKNVGLGADIPELRGHGIKPFGVR